MDLSKIPTGRNVPGEINVVIEAPLGGEPVGVLLMEDEAGLDEKPCSPCASQPSIPIMPMSTRTSTCLRIPLDQIAHFFQHYKDPEPDKWVEIQRRGDADEACALIPRGMSDYKTRTANAERGKP